MRSILLLASALMLLAACGTRGPLTPPPRDLNTSFDHTSSNGAERA